MPRPSVRVFSVEPTAVQVHWRALDGGRRRLAVGDREVDVDGGPGPGTLVVDGLASATTMEISLDGKVVGSATTLRPPPGRLLARLATVSDLHVGEQSFGHLPRRRAYHLPGREHGTPAAAAALSEAVAWGAELVVVKGDLACEAGRSEYDRVGRLLAELTVPSMVLPGNHDGGNHVGVDPVAALASYGVRLVTGVAVHELPGLRVVAASTMVPGRGRGRVREVERPVTEAIAAAPGGCLVALHHHLEPHVVPSILPAGVPGPSSRRFLDAVARANPRTFVTSGHSHRHRARRHGPLVVTEVGSVKDYPGTWAGYLVYEGGVVQVVRRVADPAVLRWTEASGAAFVGLWRRWSPGRLGDRCLAHTWP